MVSGSERGVSYPLNADLIVLEMCLCFPFEEQKNRVADTLNALL